MPFDIQDFLRRVEPEVADRFFENHGNGRQIDWQQDPVTIAQEAVAALADNDWAVGALESCQLIARSGGRDLLRTAGDHKASLATGVENIDANDETCAVWLATHDREVFDLVVSAAHARKGLGSQSWEAFIVEASEPIHPLMQAPERLEKFQAAVRNVLTRRSRSVPPLRGVWVNHFEYSLERQVSHSRRPLIQINVYGETTPRTIEVPVGGELRRMRVPGLYRAALVFDHSHQTVEVVTAGGRPVRDALVKAFHATLLPDGVHLDRLVRRPIKFELFRSRPAFDIRPDDPISAWNVDEIRLFPPGAEAGLITLECKREGHLVRDVYRLAQIWFARESPIGKDGWKIAGIRVRLTFKPERTGKTGRIVTVELKAPNRTNLREKNNKDHAAARKLFERWGIFGHDRDDE